MPTFHLIRVDMYLGSAQKISFLLIYVFLLDFPLLCKCVFFGLIYGFLFSEFLLDCSLLCTKPRVIIFISMV